MRLTLLRSAAFTLVAVAAVWGGLSGSSRKGSTRAADANALAPLFADDFDDGGKSNANGFRWAPNPVNVSVSRDIAHSGGYSLKFHYRQKPSPCDDSTAEQRLALADNFKQAWVEYYIYFPNGSEGLGAKFQHRLPVCPGRDPRGTLSNNKFFAIWDTNYSAKHVAVVFEYRRTKSGPADDSYVYGMYGTDTRASGQYGSKPWNGITDATRGRWIQIRIYVRAATSKAAKDGGYRMWADGRLVIDQANLDLAPEPGGRAFFRNLYLMGWSNSGFSQDTNVYIDDFKFYGSDPGW